MSAIGGHCTPSPWVTVTRPLLSRVAPWRAIFVVSFLVMIIAPRRKAPEVAAKRLSSAQYHVNDAIINESGAVQPISGDKEVDTERTNDAAAPRERCEEELTAECAENAEG